MKNRYHNQKNIGTEQSSFFSREQHNFLHFPVGTQQLEDNISCVLRNFWPTSNGPSIRGGCRRICTLNHRSNIISAFSYCSSSQQRIFLANHREIYDVTNASLMQPAIRCLSGMQSGDWSTFHYTTPEKTFLIALNGQDERQIYDGNDWKSDYPPIVCEGHSDINPIYFSYGWLFKNRQWYIAADSMDAWYLPVRSLGGVAKVFPLGGVMQAGGSLFAGFSWSTESGDGLSTLCVFLSTLGEVAVYGGDNPDSIDSFALKAIYHIGRPLGKKAIIFVKNDVWIATTNGLISMKNILLQGEGANLPLSSAIQEEWNQAIMEVPTGWSLTLWEKRNMLLVSCPQHSLLSSKTLVMNVDNNNYWASLHNWFTQSYVIANDNLFFGDYEGSFWQGDISGSDDNRPFQAIYLSPFRESYSYLGVKRKACQAHISLQAYQRPYLKLFSRSDYDKSYPDFFKETVNANPINSGLWDNSIWDESQWTDNFFIRKKKLFNFSQNVVAYGNFLAVGCVIVSSGKFINDIQINNSKLLVE
ncbi:MAG: hypothetical protein C6D10_03550 [Candidatus Liberibacter solanacearum]